MLIYSFVFLLVIPYIIVQVVLNGDVNATWNYILSIFPPYGLYRGVWVLTNHAYNLDGRGHLTIWSSFYFSNGLIGIVLIFVIEAIIILFCVM